MIFEAIPSLDPLDAVHRLRDLPGLIFLDSVMRHPLLGRYSFIAADPFAIFSVDDGVASWNGEALQRHPLNALQEKLALYQTPPLSLPIPFQGGAIGFFGYEFAHGLEKLPRPRLAQRGIPAARFHFYDTILAFDHQEDKAFLISHGWPEASPSAQKNRAAERADFFLSHLKKPLSPQPPAEARALSFTTNFDQAAFMEAVRQTIDLILRGDIFQANIARRWSAPLGEGFDSLGFYESLRRVNPAPFAAYLDCGAFKIASSSPERFLALRNGRLEARPIKGTIARAEDADEDRARAASLLASVKDKAENVMIVDLLRNDLSKICKPHSVHVPVLCGLESYGAVHHLVSVVEGTLEEGKSAIDLIKAAFPGGSITGAPKIRAMEIIAALEGIERGVYCGAIGYFGATGTADFNIAIRTVTFTEHEAVLHAGCGITALSDPLEEYAESEAKVAKLLQAFCSCPPRLG